ncbi:MAG: type II toxin-antitoxin system VapC family toxin [Methylococcales bacterium]|nr:type II toxin-antitoxin system VapC family toxin [Methylococcales bacterium]
MKYAIDSDILIYYLKNHPKVVERFVNTNLDELSTTIINYTELLFGAYKSAKSVENLTEIRHFLDSLNIVQFDKQSADIFAHTKARLQKEGNIIADMDLLIASICLANNLTLVM